MSLKEETLDIKNYQQYEPFTVVNKTDRDGDKYTSNVYKFDIDDDSYYVSITYFEFNPKQIMIDFQIQKDFFQDILDEKDIMCRTYTKTDKFQSFIVLSTVTKILIDYYKNNKDSINEFFFLTDDDKKHNIYKSIIRKYLSNWVIKYDRKNHDGVWNTHYQF